MKTFDRLPWGTKAVVLALSAVAIVACEKRLDNAKTAKPSEQVASSSGVLIGTTPAPPTVAEGAPPETTPIDGNKTLTETAQTTANASKELTRSEESRSMPLPGQPNDHSNLAPDASQRAGQQDPQNQAPRTDVQPNDPQRK